MVGAQLVVQAIATEVGEVIAQLFVQRIVQVSRPSPAARRLYGLGYSMNYRAEGDSLPACDTSSAMPALSVRVAGFDLLNFLLGLAWLGEVSTAHIQRLWLPQTSLRPVQRLVRSLRQEELIEPRYWYGRSQRRHAPPIRRGRLWALTKSGQRLVHEHDQYPLRRTPARHRRLMDHDVMTTEIIVRIVELGRSAGLSGLYVEREARVDPLLPRPVMDALIITRTGGGFAHANLVPWTKDAKVPGEQRRRYALENDRDSEPIATIIGKALAYQQAGTPAWVERYGDFPVPMWVVPDEPRLQAIMRAWQSAWPQGKWIITTDVWIQCDRWIEYYGGYVRERTLFPMNDKE
jgi:hypothetical protein